MSPSEPLMIEVNARDMESLRAKLGPELYREGIGRAITDLVHLAEGEIKGRTPFVTGNLRRSIMSDVADAMREAGPEGRVAADETIAVYAWWIETGENRKGHRMKTKPGGYRMFKQGGEAAADKSGEIVAAVVREIETQWSSR